MIRALWPVLGIAEGDTRVLERTPRVQALIDNGKLELVADIADSESAAVVDPPTTPPPAPRRSASREDWAEYLAEHTSIVTDGKSRDQLLSEFDALTRHPAPPLGYGIGEGADDHEGAGDGGTSDPAPRHD